MAEQIIAVDPVTGGRKEVKPARLGAIDPRARRELALVAGMGEAKYDRFNYALGYKWSMTIDSLYRHVEAFEDGEECDPESGLLHPAHAAWHGLALCTFVLRNKGTDDRINTFLAEQG